MCGRFVSVSPYVVIAESFGIQEMTGRALNCPPSFNIAPGREIAAVVAGPASNPLSSCSGRFLEFFHWGFIPAWSRENKKAVINARAETAALKPVFRDAFRRRRCLVIADGFYEWLPGKTKKPFYITLSDGRPFGMAGIYETSLTEGARRTTCAILTVAANSLVRHCHDRMPAIIPRDKIDIWLNPGAGPGELGEILRPYPEGLMEMREVSPLVNSPQFDSPRCIEPVAAPA